MPVSKLKNLAILILLLANAALLCLLVPRQLQQHKQQQELLASLTKLCASHNVVLAPDSIPETAALYALEFDGREDAEAQALTQLLGEAPIKVENRLQTASDVRIGSWENGTMSLTLQDQREVSDMRSAAKRTLKKMDFQLYALSPSVRLSPGIYSVTATQSILGVPVFSDGLTMTYANSRLSKLEGDFFTGTLMRTDNTLCCTASEAVVFFLSARLDLGWVGSAITGLEQGYLRADSAGSELRLIPVWKLHTDTGTFYINALSGAVTEAVS